MPWNNPFDVMDVSWKGRSSNWASETWFNLRHRYQIKSIFKSVFWTVINARYKNGENVIFNSQYNIKHGSFSRRTPFFRQLVKFAEYSDNNIDPWTSIVKQKLMNLSNKIYKSLYITIEKSKFVCPDPFGQSKITTSQVKNISCRLGYLWVGRIC
jgi:hypothetical protein